METAFRSEERFTQAEFREWLQQRPEADLHHYELVRGQIVMSPPAGWPHGRIAAKLVTLLGVHVESHRLGIVLDSSAGYDLPSGDTLEPDVSFLAKERVAAGPRPTWGRFLRIVPSLAVEILSPSTARRDATEKAAIYAENGVDEYWLVDPRRQEITVLHLGGGAYDEGAPLAHGTLPSHVLPGLASKVEEVFADLLG